MARQVNGHLGTFSTIAELTAKFPPSEHIGCSANVGTTTPYIKAWCDGIQWAGLTASQAPALGAMAVGGLSFNSQLPGDMAANTAAINAALANGLAHIVGDGPLYLSGSLVSPDNSALRIFGNVEICLPPSLGTKFLLWKGSNHDSTIYTVAANGLTFTNGGTSTASKLVVRTTAATDFAVGEYGMISYSGVEEYNGVWRVIAVSSTTFANDTLTLRFTWSQTNPIPAMTTPATVMSGAPTGAILFCKANANITVEGGLWNFGAFDSGSYARPGASVNEVVSMYGRRMRNLAMRDMVLRGAHYGIFAGNIYGGTFERLRGEDTGNAILSTGSGRDQTFDQISGHTYDNVMAVQQGDYAYVMDAGYISGSFAGVTVRKLHSDGAYTCCKVLGAAGTLPVRMDDFTFEDVTGWCTNGMLVFADDPGMLPWSGGAAAPGTKWGSFTVKGLRNTRATRESAVIINDVAASVGSSFDSLLVAESNYRMIGNAGAQQGLVKVARGSAAVTLVNKLTIRDSAISGDSVNCNLLVIEGPVARAVLQDNIGTGLSALSYAGSVAGVGTFYEVGGNTYTATNGMLRLANGSNTVVFNKANTKVAGGGSVLSHTAASTTESVYVEAVGNLSPNLFWDGTNNSSATVDFAVDVVQTQSTSAATFTPTYAAGNVLQLTLTQATQQILNPSRGANKRGAKFKLALVQDATGGRAVTWDTLYKNPPAIGTGGANTRAYLEFTYDGTNWMYTGGSTWA